MPDILICVIANLITSNREVCMDKGLLRELITVFLKANPEPADAQVHSLAAALGCDKEFLESVMYEMLAESEGSLVEAEEVEIDADAQEVLDDAGLDPDTIPLNDVALNDGDPTNSDSGYQEDTNDDGTDVHDIGVGFNSDDVLTDDGASDLTFEED